MHKSFRRFFGFSVYPSYYILYGNGQATDPLYEPFMTLYLYEIKINYLCKIFNLFTVFSFVLTIVKKSSFLIKTTPKFHRP